MIDKKCPTCGKDFKTYRSTERIYCSRKCYGPAISERMKNRVVSAETRAKISGPNSPHWKGGPELYTSRNQLGRRSHEILKWKLAVFNRDSFICQECGFSSDGTGLHAHHFKPWADFPELRYEVSNGQTLCEVCHAIIHGKKPGFRPEPAPCACDCGEML